MPQANRRGEATRARIRAAALDALVADGVDLTVDDVARRAGITRMTVYRHVGSREELLVSLVLAAADPEQRWAAARFHVGPDAG